MNEEILHANHLNLVFNSKQLKYEQSNQFQFEFMSKRYLNHEEIDLSSLKIYTKLNDDESGSIDCPEIMVLFNTIKRNQKSVTIAHEVKVKSKVTRKESLLLNGTSKSVTSVDDAPKSRIPVYTSLDKSPFSRTTRSTYEPFLNAKNILQHGFSRNSIEKDFHSSLSEERRRLLTPLQVPEEVGNEQAQQDEPSNCTAIISRTNNTNLDFNRDIFLSEFLVMRIRLLIDERLEYVKMKYYEELSHLQYPLNYVDFEQHEIRIYFKQCRYLLEEFYFIGSSSIISNCFKKFQELRKGSTTHGMFYMFKEKNSKLIEMHNRQLAFDLWQNKLLFNLKKGIVKNFHQFRVLGGQVRHNFDEKSLKDDEMCQKTWQYYVESFFNESILTLIKESLFKFNHPNDILSFNILSLIKFILARLNLEERIYFNELFNDGIYKIAHKTLYNVKNKYVRDMMSLKLPMAANVYEQSELKVYQFCLSLMRRSIIANDDLMQNIENKFNVMRGELNERFKRTNNDEIVKYNANLASKLWDEIVLVKLNGKEIKSLDELKRLLLNTEQEFSKQAIVGSKENSWKKFINQIEINKVEELFKKSSFL